MKKYIFISCPLVLLSFYSCITSKQRFQAIQGHCYEAEADNRFNGFCICFSKDSFYECRGSFHERVFSRYRIERDYLFVYWDNKTIRWTDSIRLHENPDGYDTVDSSKVFVYKIKGKDSLLICGYMGKNSKEIPEAHKCDLKKHVGPISTIVNRGNTPYIIEYDHR